jgi:hypothetical protein
MNYVQRAEVDSAFYQALAQEKHVVVFGASKQGKTCLCRQSIKEEDCVRIACQNSWSLGQLHATILKGAGYVIEESITKTLSGEYKIHAKFGGTAGLAGVNVTGGSEHTTTDRTQFESVERQLELDPGDVNDILNALRGLDFDKYVILEDFHYLQHRTQIDFAHTLKAFFDDSRVKFIIIGVWLDPYRLTHFNRDLSGRIITISADKWDRSQLSLVIDKGAEFLNIKFDENFVERLLDACFNSVWIVQEVCYQACVNAGVGVSRVGIDRVGSASLAKELVGRVVESQSAQYLHFIKAFIQNADVADKAIWRWLLTIVLIAAPEALESGIHLNEIYEFIKGYDQEPISESTLELYFGNHLSWYQVKKLDINPIILDFDRTRKCITVTDRGFLIWLRYQNRDNLLTDADIPQQVVSQQLSRASRRYGRHSAPE